MPRHLVWGDIYYGTGLGLFALALWLGYQDPSDPLQNQFEQLCIILQDAASMVFLMLSLHAYSAYDSKKTSRTVLFLRRLFVYSAIAANPIIWWAREPVFFRVVLALLPCWVTNVVLQIRREHQ